MELYVADGIIYNGMPSYPDPCCELSEPCSKHRHRALEFTSVSNPIPYDTLIDVIVKLKKTVRRLKARVRSYACDCGSMIEDSSEPDTCSPPTQAERPTQ